MAKARPHPPASHRALAPAQSIPDDIRAEITSRAAVHAQPEDALAAELAHGVSGQLRARNASLDDIQIAILPAA